MRRTSVQRITALFAASATTIALAGAAAGPAAAAAPDPGIAQLQALVSQLADVTETLGTVGRLAEQVPTVGVSAGQAVDFTDLVGSTIANRIATLQHYGDFDQVIAITDPARGRVGNLTLTDDTNVDGDHVLGFALDVTRTLAPQPFSFANADPAVSLSSPTGVTVKARSRLAFSIVLEERSPGLFVPYLVAGAGGPALQVDVEADIATGATLSAAVGILGVSLTETSPDATPDVSLRLAGSVADPDGDGRLYAVKPDGTDGELAGAGAAAGLFTLGFGPTAGSVALTLSLQAAPSTGFALPAVNATVGVAWPDVSTGAPVVTATGLDPVSAFMNLSTRDLGDLLGQVASTISSGQRDNGGNLELPFLSGTLADAVKGSEVLVAFIEKWVVQAPLPGQPPGPVAAGTPLFTSIQDLIVKLNAALAPGGSALLPGADIVAGVTGFDATNNRLPIHLELSRTAPAAVPVVEETVASSGVGSYGASTLTAAAALPTDLAGRRVTAGSSGGTVASVAGSTLTLAEPWTGGQPANGTPYAIAGPQVDAGSVNLADLLKTGSGPTARGIGNANAIRSTANVTPDYRVVLDVALDLSAPKTGAACSNGGCPYERSNPDGSSTVITSEPLPVERLLIKNNTQLLRADFPMTAAIDLNARAGFLAVRAMGEVKVCRTSQTDTCGGPLTGAPMLSVDLVPAVGDPADGFVPVRRFFQTLVDAGGNPLRFTASSDVRGHVSGNISVPDAAAFLGGGTAGFSLKWADVGTGSPAVDVSDLSELLAFDVDPGNPQALLGVVLRVLQLLDEELTSGGGEGVLGATIPLVDRSLRDFLGADESGGGPTVSYGSVPRPVVPATDPPTTAPRTTIVDTSRTGGRAFPTDIVGRSVLVGTQAAVVAERVDGTTLVLSTALTPAPANATPYFLRSELADALTLLTAETPDTLQELVRRLDERLGADSPVTFRTVPIGGVPSLAVDVDWQRDYATSSPVKLDLLPGQSLAGAGAEGLASIAVGAKIDVGLVVPLSGTALPTSLQVLDTSQVSIDARALVEGSISASIGPLAVSLGKPVTAVPAPTDAEKAVAKAHYSLGLGLGGSGGAVSLSTVLSDAAPVVNGYPAEQAVSCDATTGDALALCARLPLFVSTNGTSFSPPTGVPDIALRLPKDADVADLFTFSPPKTISIDDPRLRLQAPTEAQLATAFAALLLDFGTVGDGLDAFLALIEDGLNAASLEGKLPLVGGDLQAGSDFVGDLRVKLDALFAQVEAVNGGKLPSIAQVQDLLGTQFEQALTDAGANPEDFSLDLTCKLPPTTLTSATPNDAAPAPANLRYGVLTQGKTGGGATVETVLGATIDVVAAATATVQLAWTSVPAATGYAVVRSTDGGASWSKVRQAGPAETTYADVVATPGTAQAIPTQPAIVATCTGVTMIDLQGIQIRADIGTGDPNAMDGTAILGCATLVTPGPPPDKACLTGTLPLDIGIPGLSLRASRGEDGSPGGLTGKLGYRIHLALELDRTRGLSILTEDPDAVTGRSTPEIAVGASVDLSTPGTKPTSGSSGTPAIAAELAFLDINVFKDNPTSGPGFAARFAIDLKAPGARDCFISCDPATTVNGRLGFADLQSASSASDIVRTELRLEAHIAWFLKAEIESALPGVQAVFVLDWATTFDPQVDSPQRDGQELSIAFNDVAISAGGFLSEVLGPIVEQIKSVTGPLQPVIDTLYAPIPVISDLSKLAGGGDVTLITLAKAFSTLAGGPKLDFVDTVAAVVTFVNELPTGDDGLVIPIGSFTVAGGAALSTPATPDNGGRLISGRTGVQTDLAGALDNATTGGKKSLKAAAGQKSIAQKAGFVLPVLDNPASIFNLIMGQDIDLVTFDSGPLTLGFTWRQSFGPVYAPPPVFITLSGSASVTARIYAGFDTYGIRKAFEADPERSTLGGIAQVLDGLFFFSTDESGAPLPVITLFGEIAAGAAVSAVIITVGIEGGVRLTVAFSWNDPNGDGKFRLYEFGQVALRNPICLFQVSGQLTLFLRVYITIGVSIFAVSFDFTLVEVTLLDFSAKPDCEPPPPLLAGRTGTTLVLFAGKFGGAPRGDAAWHNVRDGKSQDDVFTVTALHAYSDADPPAAPVFTGVRVQALGISEDFLDPNLGRVVLDGRGYAGKIKATFLSDGQQTGTEDAGDESPNQTGAFDLEVVALGGSNIDTIKAGTGNALIDGGAGNDALTTSDIPGRTVLVAGGPGNDGVTTSNAGATVSGDSALGGLGTNQADLSVTGTRGPVSLSGLVAWAGLTAPGEGASGGNDRIAVGLGANTVYGGPGDDSVGVAADDPRAPLQPANSALRSAGNTIVLGTGNDGAKGGTGPDTIWTGPRTGATRGALGGDHGVDTVGADDGGALRNVVDTGSGGDTVFGSTAVDLVTGGSLPAQGDHLRGGGGKDVLLGGLGTDALFGGPGQDWVVAEPADVGAETGTDAFGVARTYAKTPLTGTPSSKLLVGGDDADRVVGGDGASTLFGDRYETDPCGTPVNTPLSTQPVEPTAGTAGRDLVLGGNGIDKVKAGGQADRVEAFAGDDLLCGQAGDDEIFAAAGADTVWGGSDDDLAYGDSGSDRVFGNDDDDRLFGGQDTDVLEGNDGADDVFGGTEDDVVVGGTRTAGRTDVGRDQLYGDAGKDVLVGDNSTADGSYPVDLGDLPAAGTGDADLLSGGNDDDKAYGGLAADEVLGDAGRDDLEGNGGADTVRGGADDDQIVGGSSLLRTAPGTGWPDTGDSLFGDGGLDVTAGDNAQTLRAGTPTEVLIGRGLPGQQVSLLDLGFAPAAGTSGPDTARGGSAADALFGQGGNDLLYGDAGADLAEGGPGVDRIEGGGDEDDLVGGSSTLSASGQTQPDAGDTVLGQGGKDVLSGDNAALVLTAVDAGTVVLQGRAFERGREVRRYDLGHDPVALTSGADLVEGGDDTDAIFGQTGVDILAGQAGADLVEGGPDGDTITGGGGEDDLVGGSSVVEVATGEAGPQPDGTDDVDGGDAEDVVLGDNGALRRVGVKHPLSVDRTASHRGIDLLDLGDSADVRNSGGDRVRTGAATDVVLAQSGDDHLDLGEGADYGEGGPGRDLVQGRDGEDDLVGGSFTQLTAGNPVDPVATAKGQPDSADQLRGGADDDVLTGDNAVLLRTGTASRVFQRLGTGGALLTTRRLVLLDRENPGRLALPGLARFGGDQLAGGSGVDLGYGQDGDDLVSGGGGPDYLQGNGGADLLRGDSSPEQVRPGVGKPAFTAGAWPAAPATYDDGVAQVDGQDDAIGGSDVRGFRDGDDTVEGNGGDDAVLADNGSLVRTVKGAAELTYTDRSRPTVERIAEPGLLTSAEGTRFCNGAVTCESTGAFGNDIVFGDGGDDGLWAQDGSDVVRGGEQDDDVFGELGDDTLFGDTGEDALLGDRGGVRNRLASGSSVVVSQNAPPAETYTAVRNGLYDRRVDLLNDTNGQDWVGTGTQKTMPLGGLVAGGRDRIRGGTGADQIHAGSGDDLANGDGGGDELFGDDGADVLWGGKGCEIGVAENLCVGADLGQRGTNDVFVDHLMGGRGGATDNAVLGADILDWVPRGQFTPGTGCSETPFPMAAGTSSAKDPCDWFRLTDKADVVTTNDQHHQGTDWIYGGWDRDVMQGDLAANGPNPGDRLIDWNGVYNLYNHCNAAYGGFNDVRQHSPGMQAFLQGLAYGMGSGQAASDAVTPGTSAFRELQMIYPGDNKDHATGKPYPSSPAHFDDPVACSP